MPSPSKGGADPKREIKPREPVSNSVHVIDLKDGRYEEIAGSGEVPEARVGHTAAVVNGEIYIFGGVSCVASESGRGLYSSEGARL